MQQSEPELELALESRSETKGARDVLKRGSGLVLLAEWLK